ncbi:MAG: aminoglycoside phosphotransferase family protein, partial [Proteobacteria bacterium]|nr:aminoglycoside phosphotransferase family protein [Pseudomonadota bacterium]
DSCLTITALSGGFMNANFLVRSSKGDFVFRVYSSDRVTAEREMDMLGHLEKFKVLAPLHIDLVEMNGCQIGVISYIEGETLEDVMLRKSTLKSDIFFKIGRHLAEIHKITFERTGFIGPKVNVGHQYENFGWFIKGFVRSTMEQLSDDRLDLSTRERVLKLVDDQWDKIVPQEQLKQLVHCDFNPKNIMVTRSGSLAAILDWEFCVSGNGLSDIANFFRFSYDYPTGSEDEFVAGYQSSGGLVPAKWCEAAKLLDLGNMCSFLERSEDSQKSFRTARVVVQSTLEQFGY